jgi:hypothetical protein
LQNRNEFSRLPLDALCDELQSPAGYDAMQFAAKGDRMSDHTITCAIVNNTSGTMVLSGQAPNSGTQLQVDANTIAGNGGTANPAFTGWNRLVAGCGGTVTYTLPNNIDLLVIEYNTSTTYDNSYCVPYLQSADSQNGIGCDAYYCTTSNSVSTTDDDGIVTTITISETP